MATRSIVPRANGEGSVGTAAKKWGGLWADKINGAEPNLFYLVRQNSTAYIVGDVAFTPSLPSSFYLKCIAAGTTGASEPTYTSPEVGGTVTDGTVVWQYYDLLSASGTPLGAILPYSANAQTPPHGFLYCEGQAISRTMYPDLFALIGTTYGSGDGSTTFNLPNLLGKYPQGDTTAGTVKSAGLPNIEGEFTTRASDGNGSPIVIQPIDGVFSRESTTLSTDVNPWTITSGTTTKAYNVNFDASASNAIYGNSDTVTPPTLTCRWILKAYDAPTPSSAQIDLSQYASDLAARLTREQTPAFNRRDVIATSGTYTAPVTGWYKITVIGGGGGGRGSIVYGSYGYPGPGGGEGGTTIAYEHMTAGQTATVVIGAGGAGGTGGGTDVQYYGGAGGNSTVTVNSNTYTGGGGHDIDGGTGTIPGHLGDSKTSISTSYVSMTTQGAWGGGIYNYYGCGGQGGNVLGTTTNNGRAGRAGAVFFEYFDPTLN